MLHRLLDSPTDRIVWDTGHQAYAAQAPHGPLRALRHPPPAGRHGRLPATQREPARRLRRRPCRYRPVHRRGPRACPRRQAAATSGSPSWSAMRPLMTGISPRPSTTSAIGRRRLLIVLNDNEMSISPTVGAMSRYLSRIKLSRDLARLASASTIETVERIPRRGPDVLDLSRRLRGAVVDFAQHGQLFEDLGITYIGPVPGHDLRRSTMSSRGRCSRKARSWSTYAPRRAAATGRPRPIRSASMARLAADDRARERIRRRWRCHAVGRPGSRRQPGDRPTTPRSWPTS